MLSELWKLRMNRLLSQKYRNNILKEMRDKLEVVDFTIFSQNCLGGILYHDLNLKFSSPTINMFFQAEDYIRFCENWEYYISEEMREVQSFDLPYPVAILGDIYLYLVHYKSVDEARFAWDRRRERIYRQHIFLMMTDRDGFHPDLLPRFAKLPYPKLLFSAKQYPYEFCVQIKEYANKLYTGTVTNYADRHGYKIYEKNIDIISWLKQAYLTMEYNK